MKRTEDGMLILESGVNMHKFTYDSELNKIWGWKTKRLPAELNKTEVPLWQRQAYARMHSAQEQLQPTILLPFSKGTRQCQIPVLGSEVIRYAGSESSFVYAVTPQGNFKYKNRWSPCDSVPIGAKPIAEFCGDSVATRIFGGYRFSTTTSVHGGNCLDWIGSSLLDQKEWVEMFLFSSWEKISGLGYGSITIA